MHPRHIYLGGGVSTTSAGPAIWDRL